ncbi:hypothetical protein EV178_001236 [Coemansia sp. RSA 1646]|nr:hypothetical protein EV178_001236 [Coemansia sp. RSA 1646]
MASSNESSNSEKSVLASLLRELVSQQKEQKERDERLAQAQRERDERLAQEQRERDERLAQEQRERDERLANQLQRMHEASRNILERLDRVDETPKPQRLFSPPPSFSISGKNTPTKLPMGSSKSSINQSVDATPSCVYDKYPKADAAQYKKIALANVKTLQMVSIDRILGYLGGNWKSTWDTALAGNSPFGQDYVDSILAAYNGSYTPSDFSRLGPEDRFQVAVNTLVSAIEANLRTTQRSEPKLRWMDSHKKTIRSSSGTDRKPDGAFLVGGAGTNDDWAHIVLAVEVKRESVSSKDGVLRGQLIWNFTDMARDQPRRFMLGLSVSGQGELHAYLCTPNSIFCSRIGSIPAPSNGVVPSAEQVWAVKFFTLVYWQLPLDYGFLVPQHLGIQSPFKLREIPGYVLGSVRSIFNNATITLLRNDASGGRRHDITGPRSWVYGVGVCSAKGGPPAQRILKFHWHSPGKSEARVHSKVRQLGVPYVPELLHSAAINGDHDRDGGVVGEVLLMENAGESVSSVFEESSSLPGFRIADIFAGYAHTLLAAAEGDRSVFVLHRDISTNNLMVRGGSTPFVIDWGCGLIVNNDEDRIAAATAMVGTAVYMSIRVLQGSRNRSLIDDLESLFLVLVHCLWRKYGKPTDRFDALWQGNLNKDQVLGTRMLWLGSKAMFIKGMGLSNCPSELERLATGLYDCLFPADIDNYSIIEKLEDPRLNKVNAAKLLAVFETAIGGSSTTTRSFMAKMKCLSGLREFVDKCRLSDDKESNTGRSAQASSSKKRKSESNTSGSNPKKPFRP